MSRRDASRGTGRAGAEPASIRYLDDPGSVEPDDLVGFWEGWPAPPSAERHRDALLGAEVAILAVDDAAAGRVVGFVTVVGDSALAAFIPFLEVLPEYRGRGIGRELIRRALAAIQPRYSVDLVCDEDLVDFYEAAGFARLTAMGIRDRSALP
ncbi:MAG TPA: GNAT family N-acetyltransferase [Candidatus Limnocylindrales bacterium]|nr:GNAT family N-acetyltransferase [Candidatus Limnocylindrales bacterium]